MKEDYKFVCVLSNSAAFDGLECPRTPVSRSLYSLQANANGASDPLHVWF